MAVSTLSYHYTMSFCCRTIGSVSNSMMDSGFDPMDYIDEVKQEVDDEDGSQQRPETSADGSVSVDDDVIVQNSLGSSWADHGDGPAVLQVGALHLFVRGENCHWPHHA